jgi:hypothetical protein
MNNVTHAQKDLMYGGIEFFSGEKVKKVIKGDKCVMFLTINGKVGELLNNDKNWELWLDGEKMYTMEESVYSILSEQKEAPDLSEILTKTRKLILENKIQYKSKVFLSVIYQYCLQIIFSGASVSKKPIELGPMLIFPSKSGIHISYLN